MYVWTGKHVPFDRRKKVLQLAVDLWNAGYDYSHYDLNPLAPLYGKHTSLRSPLLQANGAPRPTLGMCPGTHALAVSPLLPAEASDLNKRPHFDRNRFNVAFKEYWSLSVCVSNGLYN